MANFSLFKFGSGKDVTSKVAAVGISQLKFLKHVWTPLCWTGNGQRCEETKCREDVYFSLVYRNVKSWCLYDC